MQSARTSASKKPHPLWMAGQMLRSPSIFGVYELFLQVVSLVTNLMISESIMTHIATLYDQYSYEKTSACSGGHFNGLCVKCSTYQYREIDASKLSGR